MKRYSPVLCVIFYRDAAETIAIANDTDYGLTSYIQSSDLERAKCVAGQIDAGRGHDQRGTSRTARPLRRLRAIRPPREFGAFGLGSLLEPRAILS